MPTSTSIRPPTLSRVRRLGRGGFAETWLADVRDPELAREWGTARVAIKIPYEEYERQFKREIQLSGALLLQLDEIETHNLVRYLGFEIFEGVNVMVMEYIEGGTLRDRIGLYPNARPLSAGGATAMAMGIANGLAVIHGKNICHRDIKPENVLLDGDVPKISDLGIARMFVGQEVLMTRIGTPAYTSPEVIAGQGGDFSTDVWAAGITMYEMLYGVLPFGLHEATSPLAIARIVADGREPPVFPTEPATPPGLTAIIGRCLERDPRRRYATGTDLARDLRGVARAGDAAIERQIAALQPLLADPAGRTEASERLLALTRAHPHSAIGHYHLGACYNAAAEHDLALRAFRHGLTIDPGLAILHYGLGIAHHKRGEGKQAARALGTALALGLDAGPTRVAKALLAQLRTGGSR